MITAKQYLRRAVIYFGVIGVVAQFLGSTNGSHLSTATSRGSLLSGTPSFKKEKRKRNVNT